MAVTGGSYGTTPSVRRNGHAIQQWLRNLLWRRKNRRRGWKISFLWWVPLELALVGAVVWGLDTGLRMLANPMTFPVKDVRVVGDLHHVDSSLLEQTIIPVATGGFLRVDLRDVRKAAMALPWVDDANVRRLWPDTLRITVVEQVPVARWMPSGIPGGLINMRGEVFSPDSATYPTGLPTLDGPKEAAFDMLGHLHRLNQVFAPLQLHVTALTVDERRAWIITLNNGIRLLLGAKEADSRLARFIRVYPSALASQADRIGRVDLRYSNGFAVGWSSMPPKTNHPARAAGDHQEKSSDHL